MPTNESLIQPQADKETAMKAHCNTGSQVNCGECRLGDLCLPISLLRNDINQLDQIVQRGRPLQKSDKLYFAGDTFKAVFAVRSGSFKTVAVSTDGEEQVTGFYLPGEILGMDGIATNDHTNTAIALETSSVCEIPFNQLEDLSVKIPNLQRRFFQIMGKEIASDQELISLLSKNSADEKMAFLLLSISQRNSQRGLSATEFYLPMARSDIGNYLGLTIETVSRVLGRFHKSGLIALDKKHVVILDIDELKRKVSGGKNTP